MAGEEDGECRAAANARRSTKCDLLGGELWIVSGPLAVPQSSSLTHAERDVLRGLLRCETPAAIARRRGSSRSTVLRQIEALYRKLGAHSRSELLIAAMPAPPRREERR